MTPLRAVIIVTVATCAAFWLVTGFAVAQTGASSATKKPAVGLSAKKINFGKMPAGTQSNPRTVTLTNKGTVDLAAPLVTLTGTGFVLDSNGCVSTLHPADTCPVSVKFAPPSKGKFKHGLLKFTDQGAKSPQKVKLTGIGLAASATATPTATATATRTPTATATATASPTATVTATPTRTATTTATTSATATPSATPSPGVNVVFVTSLTYDGSINGANGLEGADAQCAALASAAHLPAGVYKAWLSTSTVDAVSRLGAARAFVRVDGAPIADQVSDLIAGAILNPIDLDESGTDQRFPGSSDVWTGSTNTGTLGGFGACVDWTSSLGTDNGETGHFDGGPVQWSDGGAGSGSSCNNGVQNHLYCFDTSHAEQLTYTKVTGRIAFVSKEDFDPSKGVSSADAICQSDATSAGLANPGTYLALLSTSTASAASRFTVTMGSAPYVRPDGIKIADAPALASGAIESGIWQHADGTYFSGFDFFVSSGSSAPDTTGALTDTCEDWTTKSSTQIIGNSTETAVWWDEVGGQGCASRPVFCLEP